MKSEKIISDVALNSRVNDVDSPGFSELLAVLDSIFKMPDWSSQPDDARVSAALPTFIIVIVRTTGTPIAGLPKSTTPVVDTPSTRTSISGAGAAVVIV